MVSLNPTPENLLMLPGVNDCESEIESLLTLVTENDVKDNLSSIPNNQSHHWYSQS